MPAFSEEGASKWRIAPGVGNPPSREGSDSQPSRDPIEIDVGTIRGRNTFTIAGRRKQSAEYQKGIMTPDLIGCSTKFRAVLQEVEKVAPVDSAVLIQGETGTGKEVIARAIHEASPRRSHRFVALNCAAIPSALLESELFGHERGAFTGACTQTKGRFQMADGGTLFLDEIGDMPLELQPKLLRALQEREFERLGSGPTIRVNVRVVAATNQDLEQLVAKKLFRADLFYRLNVIPICLPPSGNVFKTSRH